MKNWLLIGLFLLFIFGVSITNAVTKDQAFSEFENRPLAEKPTLTFNALKDGSFTADFETYMIDHFFAKTFWTGVKAQTEQAIGKHENNGVYFGKQQMLLEKPSEITGQLEKNIEALNAFKKKHPTVNMTVMLVPTAIDLYPENLPRYANKGKHQEIIEATEQQLNPNMIIFDPFDLLKEHKDETIFFRTDHHWTSLGAFYTYEKIAKSLKIQPFSKEDFHIETISDAFYGSFYAKGNDLTIPADMIEQFELKNPPKLEVKRDAEPVLKGLYEPSYLEKRDQYSYFLGGNYANTVITSDNKNGKKLLLFKDSFAHIFIPFLANHYEEIHMLDLRYYNVSAADYMNEHQLTDVLVLYNSPNFAKDTSIYKIKY